MDPLNSQMYYHLCRDSVSGALQHSRHQESKQHPTGGRNSDVLLSAWELKEEEEAARWQSAAAKRRRHHNGKHFQRRGGARWGWRDAEDAISEAVRAVAGTSRDGIGSCRREIQAIIVS